ncbi:MAG TPA: four helix bundle protein [Armatimonadota bacterium]|jgi:four helix bundle protein
MGVETFQRAEVWKKAHALVLAIYRLTDAFPRQEMYGLTSQVRRSAVSVPANIAEGYRKRSAADKLRFYNIAQGSLEETRYYMILAKDLCYGDTDALMEQLDEVSRMLAAYIQRITETPHP